MKKVSFAFAMLFVLFAATSLKAQNLVGPGCVNQTALESRIDAVEASGWVEISRDYQPIYYIVAPTPPYQAGTLTVTFAPDCDPLEPCPRILRAMAVEVWVVNENGTCEYRFGPGY